MNRYFGLGVLTVFSLLGMNGCSSVPETLSSRGIERLSQIPPEARTKIQTSLKKNLEPMGSKEIDTYLTKVANRLLAPTQPVTFPQMRIVSSREGVQSKPKLWIVPPELGYIDERILRALQFENEIAAAIAFNWERTQDLSFEKRFIDELDQTSPDFRKIYEFSELEDAKAIEGAVDLLYQSGYDPRGLISLFDRGIGTEKEKSLALQEKARRTIAFYKPLMNPIVRTNEFYQMRKKLDQL